ncbi:MAG: hypothetical protein ISR58_03610 [Anaerolineales bacterium]|nr:hypothetical protein [Chloroflexota bacterium]MBL6980259.1 hypothetical protein [Anaerolineales bacterium]
MTTSLELVLLPLLRLAGKDRPKMPGLYAANPPRRAARGRSADRFFIYLSLEGNLPLSPKELDKLLAQMADDYYKASGSSTAAMRAVAEELNELLLKRNLNSVNRGRQAIGILALGVVRSDRLYLLQSGSSHTYLIKSEGTQQFYDPSDAGRGLGLSRATNLRFYQAELRPGDVLLVSSNPPMTWNTTTLRNMHGLSMGDLYRRLIRRASGDIEAVVMLAKAGKGELRLLSPKVPQSQRDTETEIRKPIDDDSVPLDLIPEPKSALPPPPISSVAKVSGVEVSPVRGTVAKPIESPRRDKPQEDKKPKPASKAAGSAWSSNIGPGLRTIGSAVGTTLRQAAQAAVTVFERILPDESMLTLSGSSMAFIAVAVPLVVVSIAAVVYFKNGRSRYFENYVQQAQIAVQQAENFEHLDEKRIGWKAALEYLDLAEAYDVTDETQLLRNTATMALDTLDNVVRISYNTAVVEGLPDSAVIKRIVVSIENDLYLLDGIDGVVYRAVFSGNSFELDDQFYCGPVPQPLIIGPLVDIAALPPGSPNGAVAIGMDENGNLVQCIPGSNEQLSFTLAPPDSNWGTPQAFSLEGGDLYILDPLTSSVWIYDGATEFRERPDFFFGDQVPSMQDLVDLTVSDGKLYLLYADGHLMTSYYQGDGYSDPAMFQDPRNNYAESSSMADAVFSEIQFAPPPDPSIYMLDSGGRSVYHFTLQLVYQKQYKSLFPLPEGQATAFAVGQNHQIFLALGNKVYFALLP